MATKDYAKAAAAYQQGLKVAYNRPLVIKNSAALEHSDPKASESLLRDWLAKHHDDAAMRLMLAQHYLDHDRNGAAAGQYEQVLRAFPSNVGALNNYLAKLMSGRFYAATRGVAEKMLSAAPLPSTWGILFFSATVLTWRVELVP